LVQTIFHPPFGTGLLLTTAKYYTPSGRSIQRDYSVGSYYDYFRTLRTGTTSDDLPQMGSRQTVHTDNGRTVYGGGGITPDVDVKSPDFDDVRARIFGATFEFGRQLSGGAVKGQEHYKIGRTKYNYSLRGDEFPINDKVLVAFREFAAKDPRFHLGE